MIQFKRNEPQEVYLELPFTNSTCVNPATLKLLIIQQCIEVGQCSVDSLSLNVSKSATLSSMKS